MKKAKSLKNTGSNPAKLLRNNKLIITYRNIVGEPGECCKGEC